MGQNALEKEGKINTNKNENIYTKAQREAAFCVLCYETGFVNKDHRIVILCLNNYQFTF